MTSVDFNNGKASVDNLAYFLNALSKLDTKSDDIVTACKSAVSSRLFSEFCRGVQVSLSLNAICKFDRTSELVIQAVQNVSSRIDQPFVAQMNSQAVANTLNALSKFDVGSEWVIQAVQIVSS